MQFRHHLGTSFELRITRKENAEGGNLVNTYKYLKRADYTKAAVQISAEDGQRARSLHKQKRTQRVG